MRTAKVTMIPEGGWEVWEVELDDSAPEDENELLEWVRENWCSDQCELVGMDESGAKFYRIESVELD